MQLLIGLCLALLVSYAAFRLHALNTSGMAAATLMGTIIFGLGGWQASILLLLFFGSSSVLTRTFKNRKQEANEKYSKGGERDAAQVLSNGGVATLFVLAHAAFPQGNWAWIGYGAALAAVNADTWATELGVLDPHAPRLITDLRRQVEKGTSGGISLYGTLASLAGAALIALFSAWLFGFSTAFLPIFFFITLAGLAGSLWDSYLGASLQAMYYCPLDNKETEKHPLHTCGTATVHRRGWKWLNNDWVNVACSLAGAALAELLSLLIV